MGDFLSKCEIEKQLNNRCLFDISVLKSATSTNALLKKEALKSKEGKIIIACSQTEGRGRFERKFHSPDDCGIYMSILLKPDLAAEKSVLITAAAATAVAEVTERLSHKKTDIKWVNDVLIGGKKFCGILCEGAINVKNGKFDWVVLGIGINLYAPKNGYPEEISNIAASVFDDNVNELQNRFAAELIDAFWYHYERLSSKSFLGGYKSRLAFLGSDIRILKGEAVTDAKALDIDENCRLLVQYENGEREYLSSGEISIKI